MDVNSQAFGFQKDNNHTNNFIPTEIWNSYAHTSPWPIVPLC